MLLQNVAHGSKLRTSCDTPAQIALAWLLKPSGVIAIPKSSMLSRVKENIDSMKIVLTNEDLNLLDRVFPAPTNRYEGRIGIR